MMRFLKLKALRNERTVTKQLRRLTLLLATLTRQSMSVPLWSDDGSVTLKTRQKARSHFVKSINILVPYFAQKPSWKPPLRLDPSPAFQVIVGNTLQRLPIPSIQVSSTSRVRPIILDSLDNIAQRMSDREPAANRRLETMPNGIEGSLLWYNRSSGSWLECHGRCRKRI